MKQNTSASSPQCDGVTNVSPNHLISAINVWRNTVVHEIDVCSVPEKDIFF